MEDQNCLDIQLAPPADIIPFGTPREVHFVDLAYEDSFEQLKPVLNSLKFPYTSAPATLSDQFAKAEAHVKLYTPSFLRKFLKGATTNGKIQDDTKLEDSVFKSEENLRQIISFCTQGLDAKDTAELVRIFETAPFTLVRSVCQYCTLYLVECALLHLDSKFTSVLPQNERFLESILL
jgi:hypothetical protein